ncbi:Uncharacterised protein [uncultured archaeon]|nr:Uncharacterised protein [uncultured archaeon]
MLLIPKMIIITPAKRSKNLESLTKTPTREINRPRTKKTMAMPKVKAMPIIKPSRDVDVFFLRYSSFLRIVRT